MVQFSPLALSLQEPGSAVDAIWFRYSDVISAVFRHSRCGTNYASHDTARWCGEGTTYNISPPSAQFAGEYGGFWLIFKIYPNLCVKKWVQM